MSPTKTLGAGQQNYPPSSLPSSGLKGPSQFSPPPPAQRTPSSGSNYPPPPPNNGSRLSYQQMLPPPEQPQQQISELPPSAGHVGGRPSYMQPPLLPSVPLNTNKPSQMPGRAPPPGHFIGATAAQDDVGTFNGGSFRISHRDSNTILLMQLAIGCPLIAKPGMSAGPCLLVARKSLVFRAGWRRVPDWLTHFRRHDRHVPHHHPQRRHQVLDEETHRRR